MKYLVLLAFISFGCLIYLATGSMDWSGATLDSTGELAAETDTSVQAASGNGKLQSYSNSANGSAPELVLMKFGAPWCPPCRMLDKELRLLKLSKLAVEVKKINVDKDPDLAQKYNVRSIPRLILLEDGEVVGDKVGFQTVEQLTSWIKRSSPEGALAKKEPKAKKSLVHSNPFVE